MMRKTLTLCLASFGLSLCVPAILIGQSESLEDRIRRSNDELFHKGNLEIVDAEFSPTYFLHFTGGVSEGGPNAINSFVTDLRTAFPDLRVEIEVLLEHGDRVAWQRTHRGTFNSDFNGVTATGRPMVWRDMVVTRYENGKIAEEWGVSDFVERARQR